MQSQTALPLSLRQVVVRKSHGFTRASQGFALHVVPSPAKPGLQAQPYVPSSFEHVASGEQSSSPNKHSSTSIQPAVASPP
jgi:hypothetical protein